MSSAENSDGKKEAVKTYIEQTKLLVTLASAFLVAPPALLAAYKDKIFTGQPSGLVDRFLASEVCLVVSVLAGYVVLGTIAGYQHLGQFNVYRPATMFASILQILVYIAGLGLFVWLSVSLLTTN